MRVIVADDEAHITRAITMKLSKAGFAIEAVQDGQAAFEAAQRETPAMVITDFQMPRMDGLSLCRALRDHEPTADIPIILLTAKGFELNEQTLVDELRITRLVVKPFSPRELLREVQEALGLATATN